MESNFYSDEFEQLIREKTEQYKMYPSERAWKGIYSSLHTKKRWFIAGMSILVTGIIVFAGKELIGPSAVRVANTRKPAPASITSNTHTAQDDPALASAFSQYDPGSKGAFAHSGQPSGQPDGNPALDEIKRLSIVDPVTGQVADPDHSASVVITHALPEKTGVQVIEPAAVTTAPSSSAPQFPGAASGGSENKAVESYSKYLSRLRMGLTGKDPLASVDMNLTPDLFPGTLMPGLQIPLHQSTFIHTTSRAHAAGEIENTVAADAVAVIVDTVRSNQRVNWLQDYAVYNMTGPAHRSEDLLEFFITPTASFRTLSGGAYQNPKTSNNPSVAPPPTPSLGRPMSISDYADHTPALGFAVGMNLVHKIGRNLFLKAGLQFNYSRYALRSFTANNKPVNTPMPSDSAVTAAAGGMSTLGGQQMQLLHNEYYEVSAPIGLQAKILGSDRLQLNIAVSLQPTYLLNTNTYLLTTDYSHYTLDPGSFRRWNLAAGAEAFVSYRLNKEISLLAGPEFRYQIFSTYTSHYPIRENLQQFGLKIGITKSLP